MMNMFFIGMKYVLFLYKTPYNSQRSVNYGNAQGYNRDKKRYYRLALLKTYYGYG